MSAALAAAAFMAYGRALVPESLGGGIGSFAGIVYAGGGFAGLAAIVYLVGALATSGGLLSVPPAKRAGVAALIGFGAAGSQVLMGASDMVVLLVALEIIAAAGYALVASASSDRAQESAMRYFVQGGVATGLLVFALAVLSGAHGEGTSFAAIAEAMTGDTMRFAVLGVLLLVSGLAFKSGAFPFHSWVPDAYETTPAGAAAFLASGPKAAALGALVVVAATFGRGAQLQQLASAYTVIVLGSLLIGTFGALGQRSLGRMLGYSAIAQVGYAFIALAGDPGAVPLFAATYAIAVAAAFISAEAIGQLDGDWDGSIAGLAGLSVRSPVLATTLAISMLSLTGIPLTAGFVGKLFVFIGAVNAGRTWLVLAGAAASVISFGYYGAVIRAAFFAEGSAAPAAGSPRHASEAARRSGRRLHLPAVVAASTVIVLGTVPFVTGFAGVLRVFGL
jgi:NADH-quinone oxidoreductase subunit N